jgi:hypothetical protein
MNHLHPRPESERIDWRGSAALWLITYLMLQVGDWLNWWPL